MQIELREYKPHQKIPNTFYWARYGGDNNLTVCDRGTFFDLCRWDDGGRGKMVRSPNRITLLLDSLEAKRKIDHEITLRAANKILKAIPELKCYAISVLSLGPTQKLLEDDLENPIILSGTIFTIKKRLLKKYKNRLEDIKYPYKLHIKD